MKMKVVCKERRCVKIIKNKKIVLVSIILLLGIGVYSAFNWWNTSYYKKNAGKRSDITYLKREETFASNQVDYIDEEMYLEIKDIYKNIEFDVYFNLGDITKYDSYKEQYKKFLKGEKAVKVKETGEELYIYDLGEFRTDIELGRFDITDYSYYFFDMDGDENPELCVTDKARYLYIFQYREDLDQIVLWEEYISSTIFLMGTLKLGFAGGWSGDGFIRLNENGEYQFFVRFKVVGGSVYQNDMEEYGYLVSLPEYIELEDDRKEQAVYDHADERYYFRVTSEQYEELTKDYFEAIKDAHEALDDVTYTYMELFE